MAASVTNIPITIPVTGSTSERRWGVGVATAVLGAWVGVTSGAGVAVGAEGVPT